MARSEFNHLKEFVEILNSEVNWSLEGLKLCRGRGLTDEEQAWGFTKVKNEEEAGIVLNLLKKLSSQTPKLTWKILDEGEVKSKKFQLEKGKFLE